MVDYSIEKEIAVIEVRGKETVELNYIKWGNNPAKYDIRRWNDNGEPLKGITISDDGLEQLYWAISEELGFGSLDEDEESYDYSEEEDDSDEYEDENEEDFSEDNEEIQTIDYRSFFVMKSMYECDENEHDYCDVIAIVPVLINDDITNIEFPAIYCRDCNIYYVTEEIYYKLKNRGKVLCQMLSEEEYRKYLSGSDFSDLNPKGPLFMLGYTVARDKNGDDILTVSERRHLLNWIIGNSILSKSTVVNYLKFFIKKNQGRKNMSLAVKKWTEDLEYLTGIKSIGNNPPPMGVARFVH